MSEAALQSRAALFTFESEEELIGAAMYAPEACDLALARVRSEHFGDPVNGLIWATIADFVNAGAVAVPALVRDKIGAHPGFMAWGGFDRLFAIYDRATAGGVAQHADAIIDRARRRGLATLLEEIAAKVMDTAAGDSDAILADLEKGAAEIAQHDGGGDSARSGGAMIRDALDWASARPDGIEFPVGVASVDAKLGGLNRGEVTLVGARTGMGKTVAGTTIIKANAALGIGSQMFSLEMTFNPLGIRLACDLAHDRRATAYMGGTSNITLDRVTRKELSTSDWLKLKECQEAVREWPWYFDERPGLTMAQIETAARRQIRKFERAGIKPGPIIIDHLGKVRPTKDRRGNRTAEMSDISDDAMQMAKRLGVPVVALVQLNRRVETAGEDKRPVLADLRDSGSLEQDARQVIMLYRPEYYVREAMENADFAAKMEQQQKLQDCRNQLYWLIEKNSHGPRAQILTFCEIGCSAIRDWDA